MARPKADGLLYFPLDVDFLTDRKVKTLKGRYGTEGVAAYIYLLCEIYRNGYYINFDEDLIPCIADDLNISENLAGQIIEHLLSRSLLNSTLAKSVKVLTASSIQKRFQEAKKSLKRDVCVESEYWLLSEAETLDFIKVNGFLNKSEINPQKSGINPQKSEINSTKESKVKESKVKESKVKESKVKKSRENSENPDYSAVKDCFEQNIGVMTPSIADDVVYFIKNGFEDTLIVECIKKAVGANKASWNYVKGIIKNLQTDGIKTAIAFFATQNNSIQSTKSAKLAKLEPQKRDYEIKKGENIW